MHPWLISELLQHVTNLLIVAVFVIADKRDRGHAIDLAKKRVLEDEVTKPLNWVVRAKRFQVVSSAVKAGQRYVLLWSVQRVHRFWSFHANQSNSNDRRWHEATQERHSFWRPRDCAFKLFDDSRFDKTEVMNDFANALFAIGGTLRIDFGRERRDYAVQLLMN